MESGALMGLLTCGSGRHMRGREERRRKKEEEKGSICCFQLTPRNNSLEPFDSETVKGKWNGTGLALAEVEC